MLSHAILALTLAAHPPSSGAYRLPGRIVYVGAEAEPSNEPTTQYYDSKTRRLGTLTWVSGHEYRTDGSPALTLRLDVPSVAVVEKSFVIARGADRFGGSLWHVPGAQGRPTIVLVNGADDSTRAMGFLIPYFMADGLNVITYDQRGTGISSGNWRYTSPESKAADIVALLDQAEENPAVDAHRIGAWAASNGGWVAPIIATRFPLAFMILKSSPSGSIAENIVYEIGEDLRRERFNRAQISDALGFERLMLSALQTNSNWPAAGRALTAAQSEPWFSKMRIPPGITTPPPAPMLAALQAATVYDPANSLKPVFMPTLALFGTLDHNVDAPQSAAGMRAAFAKAGHAKYLTIRTLPGAGHTLECSATGYLDDPSLPERLVAGYPDSMIAWLRAKGFADHR